MNIRHLFIPKDQGYTNFIHLFIPKRQEAIWTLDICLSLKDKRLYEHYTPVYS